jgi:FixJ family two-component response regulator
MKRDAMPELDPIVIVIDDDASFRRSTERLVSAAGFKTKTFATAKDFLKKPRPDVPACVVLDVRMPGLNGLDLQKNLRQIGVEIPLIFVTGHGDIPMSVQAMKGGAVEFLTKPFRDQDLLDAITEALQRDRVRLRNSSRLTELQRRQSTLTPREREVMTCVVSGKLNKQIASELNTAEKTIKFHRAHVMQKMQANSLAALVQMAGYLEISAAHANWTAL